MRHTLVLFIMLLCLFPLCASADVDYSHMTFDQLIETRVELNKEIMSRPEWKEVTVPAGEWIVGSDIPAGSYSVTYSGDVFATVTVTDGEENNYLKNGNLVAMQVVTPDDFVGRLVLEEGYIVSISSEVIFAPAKSLEF